MSSIKIIHHSSSGEQHKYTLKETTAETGIMTAALVLLGKRTDVTPGFHTSKIALTQQV